MTRICIFGAGAIGGYVGAALHEAGAQVSPVSYTHLTLPTTVIV